MDELSYSNGVSAKVISNIIPSQPVPVVDKSKEKFESFVADKIKKRTNDTLRVAIFSHAKPDLDAIGSQMGVRHLLETCYNVEADCFVDGDVSHPQNKIAVQLLDPHLTPIAEYSPDKYFLTILVDTIPQNFNLNGNNAINIDIIIDHHKEVPDLDKTLVIHYHSGSCAGIVHQLIHEHGIVWDDSNEEHVKIASGIWAGVITDTDFCTKPETTARDFFAQQQMFQYADSTDVRKIVRFNWPMSWVKLLGKAITDLEVHDSIAVVGLGNLKSDQYHAVASIADQMLTWGNVHTSVVFAFFDGQYVSGCLRTIKDEVEVHALCAVLGGSHGQGGGKDFAGRYTKPLGAFAFEIDEDEDVMTRWWELQKQREISKILKVLNK